MRALGAATIFFDLHLNDRVGTTSAPADPSTIAAKAKRRFDFAVQVTGCATPLIAENELFGAQTRDAVERDERAVPRERAAAAAGARQPRRDDRADDREPAVHRRRRGRLVARDREGVDPRPPGLLHLAGAEGPLCARPRAGEPRDAPGDARPDLALRADRDPRGPRRARAAVPVGARPGRPQRARSRSRRGSRS